MNLDKGWKSKLAAVIAFGLSAAGFYTHQMEFNEAQGLVGMGFTILLAAIRMDVDHSDIHSPLVRYNFALIFMLALSYIIGISSYSQTAYLIVGSFGAVGLDHKVRKLKAYGQESKEDDYFI